MIASEFNRMSAAVRIRLQRWGVANTPHYRIVAAERTAKRDGRYLELLGNYNPIPNPQTGLKRLQVKKDRALYWISVGAEPSDRVAWLLAKAGLLPEPPVPTAKTISAQPKKKAQAKLAELAKKKAEESAKSTAELATAQQAAATENAKTKPVEEKKPKEAGKAASEKNA